MGNQSIYIAIEDVDQHWIYDPIKLLVCPQYHYRCHDTNMHYYSTNSQQGFSEKTTPTMS